MEALDQFILHYPEHAEEVEERAGIMEYDAGMPRDYAEEQAVKRLRIKYSLYKQGEMF